MYYYFACLLYADDQVILVTSEEELQEIVNIMHDALKRKEMKIYVNKAKVMVFERDKDDELHHIH